MPKRRKKVSRNTSPPKEKSPRGLSKADNIGSSLFRWDTNRVDCEGSWGLEKAGCKKIFGLILPRLNHLATMKWGEVMKMGSTHSTRRDEICSEAQDRLEEINAEDVEELFQIRAGNKPRIWGIREGAVFHLLWWDPDHTVYPSPRKNT